MASGAELARLSRVEAIAELERLSRMGMFEARELLRLVTADNFVELWPYIAPLLDGLMYAEQRAGRSVLATYLLATGLAAGALLSAKSTVDTSFMSYRDGRLPSGMPWARLIYGAPLTIQRRVEMGMPVSQAVNMTKFTIIGAINSQAHGEMRMGTQDVLQRVQVTVPPPVSKSPYSPAMQRLIEESKARKARGDVPVVTPKDVKSAEPEGFYPAEADYRRYIRQPNAGACPWCLMQATRGAVFYTRQTAVSAGHANCKCAVFPEPSAGAYRNVALIDPSEVRDAVWKDPRSKREYDISQMLAASNAARADLILRRPDFGLVA